MDLLKRSKPILDECGEIVRMAREQPPQNCILRIDSVSLLRDEIVESDDEDHIESFQFSAGGHKWVLCIYPNGNNKEQASGHLSLYLKLVDKLDADIHVNAALRFFIYDHIRDNYLTVMVLREKCFNAMRSIWGVAKVLPMESFTNPSNGFLFDDACIFGAEVLVVSTDMKASTLSRIPIDYRDWSYTWKIEHFSKLDMVETYSPSFTMEGMSWKLCLNPNGYPEAKDVSISLFLELDVGSLPSRSKLYVKFGLYIKNQLEGPHHEDTTSAWYETQAGSWGFTEFLSLSKLRDQVEGYIVDDVVIVEVQVKQMFMLKGIRRSLA